MNKERKKLGNTFVIYIINIIIIIICVVKFRNT